MTRRILILSKIFTDLTNHIEATLAILGGYEFLACGGERLILQDLENDSFDLLIIVDGERRQTNSCDFIDQIKILEPELKILLLSPTPTISKADGFMQIPFNRDKFLKTVQDLITAKEKEEG